MLTAVLFEEPRLLEWLGPARPFWYPALRGPEPRMAVYAQGADATGDDDATGRLRAWMHELLLGREHDPWRALVVLSAEGAAADEPDTATRVQAWSGFFDALETPPTERRFLVPLRWHAPGRDVAARVRDTRADTFIVYAQDFRSYQESVRGRLAGVLSIAALSQDDVFRADDYPREYFVPATLRATDMPGIALLERNVEIAAAGNASLEDVLGAYWPRLRAAARDLAPPSVSVRVVPDFVPPERSADSAPAAASAGPPVESDTRSKAYGHHQGLPRSWLRGDTSYAWPNWCAATGAALEASFEKARKDMDERFDEAFQDAMRAPRQREDLGDRDLTQRLREAEEGVRNARRKLATPFEFPAPPEPCTEWTKDARTLELALARRPSLAQVVGASVVGFGALVPAALLQLSLATGILSLLALVAIELAVIVSVARGVGRDVNDATDRLVDRIDTTRRDLAMKIRELEARLRQQLELLRQERRVRVLEAARRRLMELRLAHNAHRRALTRHVEGARTLLAGLGGELTEAEAETVDPALRIQHVQRSIVEHPVYAPASAVEGSVDVPPAEIDVQGRHVAIHAPECIGLRRLTLYGCSDGPADRPEAT
jgi:hypothetical protein